ncbi:MAG: class I SAM-dependent methyltransferase [Enterobacterales bacterium]|nr:class I SAM-dependent methyltransferase [Enterobacterales bacterium]
MSQQKKYDQERVDDQKRDYDQEHQDLDARQYAYDFDYHLRDYMVRHFTNWFEPEYMTSGNALELGCYKGEFSRRIQPFFNQLTVVEGSQLLIDYCQSNLAGAEQIRYLYSTFEAVDLEQKYDAIFLIHTLEHLDHPQLVLKKIKHWLTPKGKLFLAVPNANAASRQIAVKMGLIPYNSAVTEGEIEHGHRKTYALDSLTQEVKQAGFNILHQGGIMFKPLANFQMDKALVAILLTFLF